MKTKFYITAVLAATLISAGWAQKDSNYTIDSLQHFNKSYWLSYINRSNPSTAELTEYIGAQQRRYIKDTYFPVQKPSLPNPGIQQSCTNIDFESGNFSGWTLTSGFNPLYNVTGCCPTSGGAQAIMTGAGNDPCGGFPIVCAGGNFSVRLGNNVNGGQADRLEQKFMVTAANANFTYKYALVLEDPGHAPINQPSFKIEMLDSNNVQIPCTYYNVTAGQGIPGFINSTSCPGVIYKPWSSVIVDLGNYINQNVTIRFTSYDCALGGHYGYAYIDGSCAAFKLANNDTICVGTSKAICLPNGFGSYLWNGPGVVNVNTQCLTVSSPGVYNAQTTLITGCVGPLFTYSVYNYSQPVAVISSTNNFCSQTVNFTNASTIVSGSISSYTWNFGDGSTSNFTNPTHTYVNSGTYSVSLSIISNSGCYDTTFKLVTVNPSPLAAFSFSNICENAPVNFTDNSTITQGNINQWNWNFGDGTSSNLQNPIHTYSVAGTYTVILNISSNQGCLGSTMQVVNVNPVPVANFNASNGCLGMATIYNNTSSITIGNITSYSWNFGDGNTSFQFNPINTYANAGTYSITLIATSNMGCVNYINLPVTIYPVPVVNFSAPSVCQKSSFTFTNNSTIATGSIVSWNWNFGDGTPNSNIQTPSHTYIGIGNFLVSLGATSNFGCAITGTNSVKSWPLPFVSFTSNNVCFGVSNQFTNNSNIFSGSIVSWAWDFNGDGITDNTNQNPFNLYAAAGSYSVSLIAVSNANCVNSYSTVINVNPVPQVSFVGNNVCNGSPTTFSNQTTLGAGGQITSYLWNLGNGNTNTSYNPNIVYTNPGTYVVNLTATSNFACFASYTSTVIVHPNPNVNFSTTTTCFNQPTQFTNATTIQTGSIIKYRWDFDGNNTWDDSTNNPVYVYPVYGSYMAKLSATSNNNCVSQKINGVVVHANPVANFKANSTCLGDITNFTNYSTCGDGAITSWQWDFNGDNIIDNVTPSPTHNYTANGAYLCKLEVQSQYGCVNIKSKSVYVNPKPIAKFSAPNKVGCPSFCTPFTNLSIITTGNIVTNQWLFGDNSLPDYSKDAMHCYNTGNYNVTLKVVSDSGCISSRTEPNFVTVYPKPIAGFNVTPDEIDQNTPIAEITNTSTGFTSILYQITDGATYTKENFTHTFNANFPGNVLIIQLVTNEYGCTDTAHKVIKIKPAFVIYIPNAFTPNTDGLNDDFKAQGVGISEFQMWIFDRWGHVIFESNDINKGWDGTVRGGDEPIKNDVYVWKAQVTDVFHKNHDLVGHVTLLK